MQTKLEEGSPSPPTPPKSIAEPSPPQNENEVLTVTLRGPDHPDAVCEVLTALSACPDTQVTDFRHSVMQEHLNMVVEASVSATSPTVYRSLLLAASRCGLSAEFAVHERDTENNRQRGATEPYAVTLVSGDSIPAACVLSVAEALCAQAFSPSRVTRLSGQSALHALEIVAHGAGSHAQVRALRATLYALGRAGGFDVALQRESVLRRSKRLVVFDMDSTLIQQEVIDEIAKHAGVSDEVKKITEEAMCGRLDFAQSLARRVALLEGTPESVFEKVIGGLVYTKGAKLLTRTLKKLGYRLAVISGGFTKITEHVRRELGLDYDYANTLEVGADGCFTGRTEGPIVTAQRKADLLLTIAQHERITLDQVIAIGDGANDLPMLGTAGLGIAFNAKPAVQEAAQFRINTPSLTAVLYLLGFSQEEQEQLSGHKTE